MKFARYKADYVKLYVNTIMPIVKREDPRRPYVTSSPSDGIQTKKEGWIALNPGDNRFGDSKYLFIFYSFFSLCKYHVLVKISLSTNKSLHHKQDTTQG